MESINKFRQKLKNNIVCLGASISFTDPLVTDALGDSVDFFWIDLEHCAMSPEALSGHLLAARARKVPALVRTTGSTTPFIKPVLDAGAEGIIIPQIRTVDEVRGIVADSRYPPLGRRGYGPRVPSNYGRDGGKEYIENANRDLFIAVQIETGEALENLDAILAVSGVDSIVIGPWDLSAALGVLGEVENPRVVTAINRIISRAKVAGLFVGAGMGPDPEYACVMARRGVQWLQVGGDYGYLVNYMNQTASAIRRGLGEDGTSGKPNA